MAGRYAWECQTQEGGWGLDGVLREQSWKLRGIVNGIDTKVWSPATDNFLGNDSHWGYRNYTLDTLVEGKAACKAALQRVRHPFAAPRSLLFSSPSIQFRYLSFFLFIDHFNFQTPADHQPLKRSCCHRRQLPASTQHRSTHRDLTHNTRSPRTPGW